MIPVIPSKVHKVKTRPPVPDAALARAFFHRSTVDPYHWVPSDPRFLSANGKLHSAWRQTPRQARELQTRLYVEDSTAIHRAPLRASTAPALDAFEDVEGTNIANDISITIKTTWVCLDIFPNYSLVES